MTTPLLVRTKADKIPLPVPLRLAPMPPSRLRFELLFALSWLAFGALVLPGLVYAVGVLLLGAYADGGLGSFYANLFRDLFTGSQAPLALILGPYVVLMIARLPLIGRKRPAQAASREPEPTSPAPPRGRVEPRIGT